MESQCGPAKDVTGPVCRAIIVDITQSRLVEAERVRLIAAIDADSAAAAGIRAFLNKPLTKSEIARTVRRVLDRN